MAHGALAGRDPDLGVSAAELFLGGSFEAIERETEAQPSRADELVPLLVAHRLLAFLRLPQDSQCFVLRRAYLPSFSMNPYTAREAALVRGARRLANLSTGLWQLVRNSHPVLHFAALVQQRVQTYLMPQDWSPCDRLDGEADVAYRKMVVRHLRDGLPVALPATAQYLQWRRHGEHSCPFGPATAHFAAAEAILGGDRMPPAAAAAARQLVERGEALLHASQAWRSLFGPLTTQWPVWKLLARLTAPSPAQSRVPRVRAQLASVAVHVWHCVAGGVAASGPVAREVRVAARLLGGHLRLAAEADGRRCPLMYASWSADLAGQGSSGDFVVILSPLLRRWRRVHTEQLADLLMLMRMHRELEVVGLPIVDERGFWRWPVRQIRWRHAGVLYSAYPTGSPLGTAGKCFYGEATSASRVVRVEALQHLLATDREWFVAPQGPATWLVQFDLRAKSLGMAMWTCLGRALEEDDYLQRAALSWAIARRYGLETAQFTQVRQVMRCPDRKGFTRGAHLSRVSAWGWCRQNRIVEAFQRAVDSISSPRPGAGVAAVLCSGALALVHLWKAGWEAEHFGRHVTAVPCVDDDTLCRPVLSELPANALAVADSVPGCASLLHAHEPGAPLATAAGPQGFLRTNLLGREVLMSTSLAALRVTGAPHDQGSPGTPAHVWRCGPALPRAATRELHRSAKRRGWHLRLVEDADGRRCPARYAAWLRELEHDSSAFVVLLSALLRGWRRTHSDGLHYLLSYLGPRTEVDVFGLPRADKHGIWHWPARRLRLQYWRLRYSAFAAGDRQGAAVGTCFREGTTSASRAIRASALQRLLGGDADLLARQKPVDWLLQMDLRTHVMGIPAWTCLGPALEEEDYLTRAGLPRRVAERYGVEVAELTSSRRVVRCPERYYRREDVDRGLVTSWCWRKWMSDAFHVAVTWWTRVDPTNLAVPDYGTLLSLLRGGEQGLMPWDVDIDALFLTAAAPFDLQRCLNEHPDAGRWMLLLRLSMEGTTFACREGDMSLSLLFRGRGAVDVTFGGGYRAEDFPLRVQLFGTEVHLNEELLLHLYHEHYDRPEEKLMGSEPLHCRIPGHPACLPDCRTGPGWCEFEDHFVHGGHTFEFAQHPLASEAWFQAIMRHA